MACRPPCADGWIVRSLERAGYVRVPELDRRDREGWISPGGARCWFPRRRRIEVRQLCSCKRRAWNIAIPAQGGARHPAAGSERRLQ